MARWVALEEWKLRLTSVKVEVDAELTTSLDVWGWWVALEEWKLRLTSAKVEVEAELGKNIFSFDWVSNWWLLLVHLEILQD